MKDSSSFDEAHDASSHIGRRKMILCVPERRFVPYANLAYPVDGHVYRPGMIKQGSSQGIMASQRGLRR
jgi:hypothetical protein